MPKNRSSRTKKLARQAASRARRGTPATSTGIDVVQMHAALEQVAISGAFPVAGPSGETERIPFQQIVDWHNAQLAADGEPPLALGEISEILMGDVMFGRLRLLSDGLWECDEDYFNAGGQP